MDKLTQMTAQQERVARRRVNNALHALGLLRHDSLPIAEIDAALAANGFEETEPAIYCGRDGNCSPMRVGTYTYLSLSWHKYDSGRYEVVAYVN
jgi:hypothetical protein